VYRDAAPWIEVQTNALVASVLDLY
jgi:hypothetical protein